MAYDATKTTIVLSVEYTLAGNAAVLARPYYEWVGFNYNRLYHTPGDLILDFVRHGWNLTGIAREGSRQFYTFSLVRQGPVPR